jgi:iodotyrosine deiodinase
VKRFTILSNGRADAPASAAGVTEQPYRPVPLAFARVDAADQRVRARTFFERIRTRRSVRDFAPDAVPDEVVELAIATAGTAPSGANMQPWHFVVVRDAETKRRIREAAEAEERASYEHRMPDEWLEALAPLGTDWRKPFLETAPVLIVVFRADYHVVRGPDGAERRVKHYYVAESVGIACGFLLAALHWSGLATLTHTPSPMGFLSRILERPPNEKPYLLIPVGYPAEGAVVPAITKKDVREIRTDVS